MLKLRVIKLLEEQTDGAQAGKEGSKKKLFITILMHTSAHTTVLFINLEECENIVIREYNI